MTYSSKIKKGKNLGRVPLSEQRPPTDTKTTKTLTAYEFWFKYERKEGEPVLTEKEYYERFPLGTLSIQLANTII